MGGFGVFRMTPLNQRQRLVLLVVDVPVVGMLLFLLAFYLPSAQWTIRISPIPGSDPSSHYLDALGSVWRP